MKPRDLARALVPPVAFNVAILAPHFRRVTVFETIYPSRHNLYFWASDGSLPFRDDWGYAVNETAVAPRS